MSVGAEGTRPTARAVVSDTVSLVFLTPPPARIYQSSDVAGTAGLAGQRPSTCGCSAYPQRRARARCAGPFRSRGHVKPEVDAGQFVLLRQFCAWGVQRPMREFGHVSCWCACRRVYVALTSALVPVPACAPRSTPRVSLMVSKPCRRR